VKTRAAAPTVTTIGILQVSPVKNVRGKWEVRNTALDCTYWTYGTWEEVEPLLKHQAKMWEDRLKMSNGQVLRQGSWRQPTTRDVSNQDD
jgi:hypothetical protein